MINVEHNNSQEIFQLNEDGSLLTIQAQFERDGQPVNLKYSFTRKIGSTDTTFRSLLGAKTIAWSNHAVWPSKLLEQVKMSAMHVFKLRVQSATEPTKVLQTLWSNEYLKDEGPSNPVEMLDLSTVSRKFGDKLQEGEVVDVYMMLVSLSVIVSSVTLLSI